MESGTLLLGMSAWKIFAAIGVILAIAEIFVSGFILLPIGLAFLVTSLFAVFVDSWPVLLTILAVTEIGVYLFFSRVVRPRMEKSRAHTNAEGMIGQEAEVVEPIPEGGKGYVKLYGDLWQAVSSSGNAFEKGMKVRIARIDGNKVLVERI